MRSLLWRWHRHGFELRMLTTLVLTLATVGVFQYVVTTQGSENRLRDWANQRAYGDVVFIQQAFDRGKTHADRVREMNDRLSAIQARPGTRQVFLVDRFGVVAASNRMTDIGTYHGGPGHRSVVATGAPATEVGMAGDVGVMRYLVPVELPTGRFVLAVEQDASVFDAQRDQLQRSALFVVLVGVAVGFVLFFLLGGRSLAEMHRRALRLSTSDGLTHLSNHRSFQERLAAAVATASKAGTPLSLALVDLDDFKLVNDRLGHLEGDEVLKQAAALLVTGRNSDTAFRIGGDEFALLLPETDAAGARAACERLWNSFNRADLRNVTVSIGIATLTPQLGAADLHERADVALYEAKRRGRNGVVSVEELNGTSVIPVEKVRAVRKLLQDRQLGTAFQPIWDLAQRRVLGFEALARPLSESGVAHPGEMFSIGELIGRTMELDALSWERALDRARDLPDDVLIFLNISPFTADHGDGPIDVLYDVVRRSCIPPQRIVVELTEKWSGRRDLVIEQAERLRALGFRLALDDVGAGSGDLEMMARLPVDFIKIDMHVVKNARIDPTARGVLSAITAFAAHSGSFVIAEGIEDLPTLAFVRSDEVSTSTRVEIGGGQGYYLGAPRQEAPDATAVDYPFEAEDRRALR